MWWLSINQPGLHSLSRWCTCSYITGATSIQTQIDLSKQMVNSGAQACAADVEKSAAGLINHGKQMGCEVNAVGNVSSAFFPRVSFLIFFFVLEQVQEVFVNTVITVLYVQFRPLKNSLVLQIHIMAVACWHQHRDEMTAETGVRVFCVVLCTLGEAHSYD